MFFFLYISYLFLKPTNDVMLIERQHHPYTYEKQNYSRLKFGPFPLYIFPYHGCVLSSCMKDAPVRTIPARLNYTAVIKPLD